MNIQAAPAHRNTSPPSGAHRPVRAVVFDLDGLMFNTEQLYQQVGGEVLRRRGKELTRELLDRMIGRPSRISLQIMIDWHDLGCDVETLQRENDEIFDEIMLGYEQVWGAALGATGTNDGVEFVDKQNTLFLGFHGSNHCFELFFKFAAIFGTCQQ